MADAEYGRVDCLPLMREQAQSPPEDIARLASSRFDEIEGVLRRESCVTSRGYNPHVFWVALPDSSNSSSANLLDIPYRSETPCWFETSPTILVRTGLEQTNPDVQLWWEDVRQYQLETARQPGFPFK
jgi:hypothetical protein